MSRENTWPRGSGGTISLGELEDTAQEIVPRLWMGGRYAARLVQWNFDVVVNLTYYGRSVSDQYSGLYLEWPIEDGEDPPDLAVLSPLVDFLQELHYSGKTVLIHCQAGLNRSGLVMALVLRSKGWTADGAIAQIRAERDEYCLCNADFEAYVRGWTP